MAERGEGRSVGATQYIRDFVRKFTAGSTKPKFTWWRADASFIAHPKCFSHRMVCKDICVSIPQNTNFLRLFGSAGAAILFGMILRWMSSTGDFQADDFTMPSCSDKYE